MRNYEKFFEANKELWNLKTNIHQNSEFYNAEKVVNGASSLNTIEQTELGDISGKSLLHLQCHFGLDSISLARKGAHVTAVDISDKSIKLARTLAKQSDVDIDFICCNVYDIENYVSSKYDIIFTSYGVIYWLPDLGRWAELVAKHLKKGGQFYMVEFHPLVWIFDEEFQKITYPYHNTGPIEEEIISSYTKDQEYIGRKSYGWNHAMSEVVNALINQGMELQFLNEFPYSPYNCFNNMVKGENGGWVIGSMPNKIPLVFSVKLLKK